MHGKPNFKPTASPTSYTGSKPTDSQKKKKKKPNTDHWDQKPQISSSVHQKSLKLFSKKKRKEITKAKANLKCKNRATAPPLKS